MRVTRPRRPAAVGAEGEAAAGSTRAGHHDGGAAMLGRCPHGRGAPLEGQQPRRVPGGRCGRAPEGGLRAAKGGGRHGAGTRDGEN